jgi:hypothetical protein
MKPRRHDVMLSNSIGKEAAMSGKKLYRRPKLHLHGSVEQITLAMSGGGTDGMATGAMSST